MHDLGDALLASGFADPVMDMEPLTLTWPDAPALLAELSALGGNASAARCAVAALPSPPPERLHLTFPGAIHMHKIILTTAALLAPDGSVLAVREDIVRGDTRP